MAEERRKESKQKKQQMKEKRVIKSMAQDLLTLLDKNVDVIRRRSTTATSNNDNVATDTEDFSQNHNSTTDKKKTRQWQIHLWTDTLPSNSPPFLDTVEDADLGGEGGGGKSSKGGKKTNRRARSGSISQDQKKKHPRSKNKMDEHTDDEEAKVPLLCRSHFFSGKCADPQSRGKKGGCRCLHYNNKQFKTISTILHDNKQHPPSQKQQRAVEIAEEACGVHRSEDVLKAAPGSMEMVYYLAIPIPSNIGESQTTPADMDEDGNSNQIVSASISDLITEKLSESSCNVTSIVYMVLSSPSRDVLLYDRNQEGLVITDVASEVFGSNTSSVATLHALQLPVSILEHILTFLEAPALASTMQVCTAWHREICQVSPELWKHFFRQRSWPLPSEDFSGIDGDDLDTSTIATGQNLSRCLRSDFIKHYSVLRDIRAVQHALTGLLTSSKSCEEKEMTFQAFAARRGAPQPPNNCIGVEVWSPNQVLAAYSNDCTLRQFQAVARGGNHATTSEKSGSSSLSKKSCRELVCQCIDPYKKTKKKSCYMEAMALDENVIGCLCSVSDETSDFRAPHILVILSRDDLLVVDPAVNKAGRISEPDEGALHVIDVEGEGKLILLLSP